MTNHLDIQIKSLPDNPGVYQYYDKNDKILYIGKAKNIKKRVSSYFNRVHDTARINVLVKNIAYIKHIVVETETDALLLENSLIKTHQPRYNVLLKDDKTYPWICIKKEVFPRVFTTRLVVKDGSEYFGPYTNKRVLDILMQLIQSLYPLRNCRLDLSQTAIKTKNYRVCLEYHIGNCAGPCEEYESDSEYNKKIQMVRTLLKGDLKAIVKEYKEQMNGLVSELKFEEAQQVKEKIELLEKYQAKSTIVSPTISNTEVYSILSDHERAYVNMLQIKNGAIMRSHTLELKKVLDETDEELLQLAIVELRNRFQILSREIIVPFPLDLGEIKTIVPKLGEKKQLLDLSLKNATYFKLDQLKQIKILDPERHTNRLMQQMKSDLRLSKEPRHIECFDNSNIQGTNPVAACVVFKDGKPSKKDYRHFKIKTVEGPNDFASMEEVVYRRYSHLLEENLPLPDLIVIDGGKGQLGSALNSLEKLGLRGKIAIIGIAKRLEEIFYPGDSYPMYLDKKSETLKTIQHLRNEAHRFGITFHRNQRSKNAIAPTLTKISGIGDKTMEKLMREFKSIKRLKETPLEEIEKVIGKAKAKLVVDYFQTIEKKS